VTSNDPDKSAITLTIKGEVIPKPKTKSDNYPSKIGNLRFKTNHLAFQEITNRTVRTDTLGVYNEGKATITIKGFKDVPEFLKVEAVPLSLKHDEEGVILITYDAEKRNDFGYVFDRFMIETDDVELADKLMYVSANISFDFSWMTEKDKEKAPKIVFEKEIYNYGQVKTGEMVEYDFLFRNEGKEPLKLLKVRPSCGCTGTIAEETVLKSGKGSKINVKFNTAGRSGQQHHNITIHTNDPEKPVVVIYIQGEVIK
jgi:hypothetical protein